MVVPVVFTGKIIDHLVDTDQIDQEIKVDTKIEVLL